jgi:hypothetical protein
MNRDLANFPPHIHREARLLAYFEAVERGDLDAQDRLLAEGAHDPQFVSAAWEIHMALAEEAETMVLAAADAATTADAETVRDLARRTLESPVMQTRAEALASAAQFQEEADAELDERPLTLRDVADRLRADTADGFTPRRYREATQNAANRLAAASEPLEKEHLTERGAQTLLQRLGLAELGIWFVRQFHQTALAMKLARQRNSIQMAAARRQRSSRPSAAPRAEAIVEPDAEGEEGP